MTRIAIDVDDTLYSFTQLARSKFVDFAIERDDKSLMRAAYCAWVEWRSPADVIDLDYWKQIIASCHKPDVILAQEPFEGAADVIAELVDHGYDITYISDRSREAADATVEWITEHFPTPPGTKFRMERMDVKSQYVLDCQYMIDDRPKNLVDFIYDYEWTREHVWNCFDQYPRQGFGLLYEHNRALTDIPGIFLAPNWKLLREYLVEKDVLVDRRPDYTTGTGQPLTNVHPRTEDCATFGCSVHSPSDHGMRDFPTHWRSDRGLMERICPHGVGHPDPDHLSYTRRTLGLDAAYYESIHGCDGCCHD